MPESSTSGFMRWPPDNPRPNYERYILIAIHSVERDVSADDNSNLPSKMWQSHKPIGA